MKHNKVLITGGAGFIGSAVVRQFIRETETTVINVDKLTCAGNLESFGKFRHRSRHVFEHLGICTALSLNVFSARISL